MRRWITIGAMIICGLLAFGVYRISNAAIKNNTPPEPIFTFQVISDIHLVTDLAVKKLQAALSDLQQAAPKSEALIINGDLGNGRKQDYETLYRVMSSGVHPDRVYYTMGNHEYYKAWYNRHGEWSKDSFPNGETDQASLERFLQLTKENKVYYDRWIKGYHFIMLGSERYRQTDPSVGDDAYLSEEQLTWLSTKLAEGEQKAKPIFIFLHQPLPNTVAGSRVPNYRGVVEHQKLKEILANHPTAILFTGHTHWELKLPNMVIRDQFAMINSSSVFEPWSSADMPIPAIKGRSERLVVEVYNEQVRLRGRDFRNHKWILEAQHVIKW
jgi:3',5'-cyclic-AMP phosphodiesterase